MPTKKKVTKKKSKANGQPKIRHLSAEDFKTLKGNLGDAEKRFDSIDEAIRHEGLPTAPPLPGQAQNLTLREALNEEGLTLKDIARRLRMLLETQKPVWNREENQWDYFIDAELYRRCLDMCIQAHGGYAPEGKVNLNINLNLEKLLHDTSGTPEEQQKRIQDHLKDTLQIEGWSYERTGSSKNTKSD